MPSAPRIFSRNQYAPVIFWEAATLRAARGFAMDDSRIVSHSAFRIWHSSPARLRSHRENHPPLRVRRYVFNVHRLRQQEVEVQIPELRRRQQPGPPDVHGKTGLSAGYALNGDGPDPDQAPCPRSAVAGFDSWRPLQKGRDGGGEEPRMTRIARMGVP